MIKFVFGSARARACEASLPPGSNGMTEDAGSSSPGHRTNVHFRSDSWLISNANCPIRSGLEGSDRLHWETLALWIFVVFSFAALIFAGYVIWAKCDGPSPF